MRRLAIALLSLLVLFQSGIGANRRTSGSVRQEKQETAKKIDRTRRQIKDNLEQTKRELAKLGSIRGEMKVYQGKSGELRKEAEYLGARRKALSDSIDVTSRHIEALKASYEKALIALRTQRHTPDAAFIFSSESFSQTRSRARYLRELSKWQKEKAASLQKYGEELNLQRNRLDSVQTVLKTRLDSIQKIERELAVRKGKADALVNSLKRQSKNLNKVLAEQQRIAKQLDNELSRLIEEEARAEKAGKGAKQNGKTQADDKAAAKLSGSFANNKGRLPWPIDGGATVVSDFGRHTHSDYSKVEIQNNGIDFESSAGAHAKAVFPGKVSMIIVMEGYKNVILIRHGDYLTVYAGIDELKVRKGQEVKAGESLGTLAVDPASEKAHLHFEVRHEKEKLDPSQWLKQ